MKQPFDKTRRSIMQVGLSALATVVATPVMAAVPNIKGLRGLAFHNVHTDEKLSVTYWRDGKYDRAACTKINHILRDHYSGDVHPMDVRLFDVLYGLNNKLGHQGNIEVVSGYRSPHTNMMLAKLSDGVAKQSYHTRGMAIDISMPGTPLSKVYHTALNLRRGGVGYYPDSQFVHVDVGPVRTWEF